MTERDPTQQGDETQATNDSTPSAADASTAPATKIVAVDTGRRIDPAQLSTRPPRRDNRPRDDAQAAPDATPTEPKRDDHPRRDARG